MVGEQEREWRALNQDITRLDDAKPLVNENANERVEQ